MFRYFVVVDFPADERQHDDSAQFLPNVSGGPFPDLGGMNSK
jgi:hypothetical protein